MMMRSSLVVAASLTLFASGCLEQTLLERDMSADEAGDDRSDDAVLDGPSGCLSSGEVVADGVLSLVNDPALGFSDLDTPVREGGVGLDRRAAEGIIDGRPFADLAELDAVPYVGASACVALAQRACNVDGRCRAPVGLMSWNTEQFPLTPAAPQGVVDIVEEYRPVLVGMQEIDETAALDQVVTQLDGYTSILGEPGPYTRVAALVDEQAFAVQHVEHLFVEDWWAFPRPVLAITGELVGAVKPTTVTFMVVHLKAMGDDTSRSRREDAVQELRVLIDERRAAGAGQIVIVGDWNDKLTDPVQWNVFTPLLSEAASATFLTEEAAELGDASYIPWSSMIDHVMVTDEVLDAMPHDHTEVLHLDVTWSEDYEDTVSDHRPVLSVLELAMAW